MGATNGTIKENKNLLNTYEIMKEIKIQKLCKQKNNCVFF